jgi:hypothetical protein
MSAIARDFYFSSAGIFAALAAVLLVISHGAAAWRMRTFFHLSGSHE